MPLNLDEVPASNLIEALCKRYEATVVITTDGETWSITRDGNGFTCYGMMQCALQEMKLASLQPGTE